MSRFFVRLIPLLILALALAACIAPVAPAAEAPAADAPATDAPVPGAGANLPNLEGRVVQAAMANDYTPFQFIDPQTGEAVGWEYDAMAALCQALNCAVEFNNTTWEAMIPAVQDGQFDIGMDGITITAERAEQVDFSAPYIASQQFMLVRADEERFAAPADFAADANLLV
ncbi:MAG: transporter substrate-binding domain-containing protein, partial [Caldilineaceae bacterium]